MDKRDAGCASPASSISAGRVTLGPNGGQNRTGLGRLSRAFQDGLSCRFSPPLKHFLLSFFFFFNQLFIECVTKEI